MKKILLASTAVMLSAGFAAADVTVGGSGRMGVVYIEDITGTDQEELAFNSRIRITFAASGETDGGLTFGGSVRADNAVGGNVGTGGSVFVAGAFGRITMGDIDSAAEQAIGDISGVGYSAMSDNAFTGGNGIPGADFHETAYLTGGDDEGALYQYTTGGLSVYASAGQPQSGEQELSLGVSYTMDTYTFGLGYEDKEDVGDHLLVAASAGFGAATVKAVYGTADLDAAGADFDQYGISLDYVFGATTVTGFYRGIDPEAGDTANIYGLGATYDLGGGAALEGGIVNIDLNNGVEAQTRADFGITMNF